MGTTRGKDIPFRCWDDCRQTGCPGHVLRMDYQRTSDGMLFYQDNELLFGCDPDKWKAMLEAEKNCG